MSKPRLRDLGVSIGVYAPGLLNAITDVARVGVGHCTLIEDDPRVVRTGITVVMPRPNILENHAFAGFHRFNGNGDTLDRVNKQLRDMVGKNRVLFEDLNILAEAIPTVFDIMREDLKLSDQDMQNLNKSGKDVLTLIYAIGDGLERRYKGSALAASRTLEGIFSNIRDAWTNFQKDILDGGLFEPGPGEVADCLGTVLVAPRRDDAIEVCHQIVVERNGHALHGLLRRLCGGIIDDGAIKRPQLRDGLSLFRRLDGE